MVRLLTLFAFLTLLVPFSSDAQLIKPENMKIYVMGTVYDEFTKEPLAAKLVISDSTGIVSQIRSHEKTGMYQVVLEAGGVYTVEMDAWNVVKKTEKIRIIESDEFVEQKIDFYVKRFTKGIKFDSSDVFTNSSAEYNKMSKYIFEYLEEILKFNRPVKFNFVVSAHDQFKEGSGATEAQIKELVDARVEKLQEKVNTWKRFKRRIKIIPDYTLGKEFAHKNINGNDLDIIVREIKNLLD